MGRGPFVRIKNAFLIIHSRPTRWDMHAILLVQGDDVVIAHSSTVRC